jgi:DNA-binding CsgD family transcriptional regulator
VSTPNLAPPGPATPTTPAPARTIRSWPILLLALPAFVAIWSGWVGLGELTGFGPVKLLPGIWDAVSVNSAITLPIGMETYAAYALHVMLSARVGPRARSFARWSALGSLVLGAAGQVAYHLMSAARIGHAPWQITALVACLPVAVLGMGAALAHLVHEDSADPAPSSPSADRVADAGPSGSSPTPDAAPDSAPGPDADSTRRGRPARATGTTRTPRPATTGRTGAGTDTAAKVARLRAKHPDITQTEIAKRLGLSERTVRRHLNPTTDPDGHAPTTTLPTTDPTTTTTEPGDDASQAA